jgi:gamma-glutamyltranspeptidase/glutathione hydrolase
MALTGKPLSASAGAMTFSRGGNAVDAACAMLAAAATIWDTMSWGGETQALIYNPNTRKVVGINALGVAPTGATVDFFQDLDMNYPPEHGPLAATTPGTPGGLMVMLAEYGTLSLAEILAPAMELAAGYPIEEANVIEIEENRDIISQWPESKRLFLPHLNERYPERWAAPRPGEILRQPDLLATLQKLVDAEAEALAAGSDRKPAIYAAYDRFYRGDIAEEIVRSNREDGGLFTMQDLGIWQVHIEAPVKTRYKGIEVYKLDTWAQGPALLQALNILEKVDLKDMGYNSVRYIHWLYQTMNLVFADRDFYYGDTYFPPEEPIVGLLSKEYANQRRLLINEKENSVDIKPGDPYPYQGDVNPYEHLRQDWTPIPPTAINEDGNEIQASRTERDTAFVAGTTSIQAADAEGWVVSVTPSGGWVPAYLAGNTGIGLSQRMQSFVLDEAMNPFNVLQPGKRPRVTLTPSLALIRGRPLMAFSVQGGDTQEQNLLQFFLNVIEFGMDVQQAAEAANFTSYQMQASFGTHDAEPGRIEVMPSVDQYTREQLSRMGYTVEVVDRTYSPITAIIINPRSGVMEGGVGNTGDDYGIAW